MSLLCNLLAVLALLLASQLGSRTLAARLGAHKACSSCKELPGSGVGGRGQKEQTEEASTSLLALGEPCGVYTLSCATGLRCIPPPQESSPLQALLQGRGVCSRNNTASRPQRPLPTGVDPLSNGELEKGPCRKLQNAVLEGLELTVFQFNTDIYIPNWRWVTESAGHCLARRSQGPNAGPPLLSHVPTFHIEATPQIGHGVIK
ncbi:hypothetical protein JZ751_018077 [Albula glossodonta]|uniref:IGFBP N-terminal domain-containing protein n=1 Tax=Albula glossodonta TaxID=121402 RepID=A0A8T2PQ38_9TELE|nr:hypothetical protein JZ751_018077 [Albula glossodonta]